jgi:hypothetical protein
MKLYRNYDGRNSTFGDISLSAPAPNPDALSSFAAVRSGDSALTLMMVNKQMAANTATIVITNFSAEGTGQVWQLTSANTIARLADVSFSGSSFTNTLPPQSVTLFVLPAATQTPQNDLRLTGEFAPSGLFTISFLSRAGHIYRLERSVNLNPATWSIVVDDLAGTGELLQVTDNAGRLDTGAFYRVVDVTP